jgi:hypothetical protein
MNPIYIAVGGNIPVDRDVDNGHSTMSRQSAPIAYGGTRGTRPQATTLANYTGTDSVNVMSLPANSGTTFPVIELHVAGRQLKDVDIITVSDPICVLFTPTDGQSGGWTEVARTEVVWNNLNPQWVTFFRVMYVFEIRQPLMFRVYDVDSATAQLNSHDFIGEAQIDLAQIVSQVTPTELTLTLPGRREPRGTLVISHEQVENISSLVCARFIGERLKKMRFLFSNAPFFVVAKAAEGGLFLPVYQSEVNPTLRWRPFVVSYQSLCNGDPNRPLRVTFFDYRSSTAAVPIGHYDTSFARMCEGLGQKVNVVDGTNQTVGQFTYVDISLMHKYSFYDFLQGGLQLGLVIGIDFTGSNGDPSNQRSLHYISRSGDSLNQYERCIRSVGEILCPYDSDQLFPVLGFGARIASGPVNHCFSLTFSDSEPCVRGLEGIIGVYRYALTRLTLAGPTLFAPIIREASRRAVESFRTSRTYTILLMMTDGLIDDMADTIDAIVAAGRLPLSIIIIGVGTANFDAMDVLDADDRPLVSRTGQRMARDLVQFVPFCNFANRHYSALAAAVLEEVPRQLCEWADMNGVYPQSV